jgi:seryl-tRNA synthetase
VIDLKQLRENPESFQARLKLRGEFDLSPVLELDQQQRGLEVTRSQLQARSNEVGKLVGQKMQSGGKPQDPEIQALRDEGAVGGVGAAGAGTKGAD